jgi:hypothetical protein
MSLTSMTWLEPSFTQPFVSSRCTNQRCDNAPDRILEKPRLNLLARMRPKKYCNSINNLLSYLSLCKSSLFPQPLDLNTSISIVISARVSGMDVRCLFSNSDLEWKGPAAES